MKFKSFLSLARDVFRVRKLRAELDRQKRELSKEEFAAKSLRLALEAELTNTKVAVILAGCYRRSSQRLEKAIDEVAIPALRRSEGESGPSVRALREALSEPVDEEGVRQGVMEAEEWL